MGLVTLVALGGIFIFFKKSPEGGVACTMEALQCPDGSYIGRSGPSCEFTACPGASFIGTLVSTQSGLVLHTDAPQEGTQEVVYVLPLNISGDVRQNIGKRVKVSGVFVKGNVFQTSTIEVVGDAYRGEVMVGQSVLIQGVRITLNKIVQDSRCPSDVQCIQAGSVTAEVTLQSNTDKEVVQITSGKAAILFDSYKVSIDSINPLPLSTTQISQGEYRIVFKVE